MNASEQKKHIRWLIIPVLVLILLCLLFHSTGYALNVSDYESLKANDDFLYRELTDGTIEIVKYIGYKVSGTVSIPDEIDEKPVSVIGENAFHIVSFRYDDELITTIEHVILPSTLKIIKRNAFDTLLDLRQIKIPEGVVEIGDFAFHDCPALTEISLPSTLEHLGTRAFGNSRLSEIYYDWHREVIPPKLHISFPNGHPFLQVIDDVLFNMKEHELLYYPSWKSNETYAIPEGIQSIRGAFCHNETLVEVNLPESLHVIGEYAFYTCSSLSRITLPSKLESIGNYSFYNCINLSEINLPLSLDNIGEYAFFHCSSLTELDLPNGLSSIGSFAFFDCSIHTLEIPASVSVIGANPFASYFNDSATLINVTLSENNPYFLFEDNMLMNNTKDRLIYVRPDSIGSFFTVPDGIRVIDGAFYECNQLEQIDLPQTLEEIGPYSFYYTGLQDITFPANLKIIGRSAFGITRNLQYISFPDSLEELAPYAFDSSTIEGELILPPGIRIIQEGVFESCDFITKVILHDNIIAIEARAFRQTDYGPQGPVEIVMNDGLRYIGDLAFSFCNQLSKINLPSSLTCIGVRAFDWNAFKELTISGNISHICWRAFAHSFELETLTIEDGVQYIDDIFTDCRSLITLSLPSSIISIETFDFNGGKNLHPGKTSSALDPENLNITLKSPLTRMFIQKIAGTSNMSEMMSTSQRNAMAIVEIRI